MEAGGRIVREYSGFLPCSRLAGRHILRCEHLRDIPGEGFSPYRVEPEFTHQIWLWYRTNAEPDRLNLVFRGQFNFTLADHTEDWVAAEVTDFLAEMLWEAKQLKHVTRNDQSDTFWIRTVATKLQNLAGEQP